MPTVGKSVDIAIYNRKIGDTSNDLREISDIDSIMKDHINLAINLAKTEILRRLKN